MRYFNHQQQERPPAEAFALFGNLEHKEAEPGTVYRMAELHDSGPDAPACISVTVLNHNRTPLSMVPVCWSWPDAPKNPDAGWSPRAETHYTDALGQVHFPMGRGAYYAPPTPGPHSVWIHGGRTVGDFVAGLGMLKGTNHRHLDLVFILETPNVIPGPAPVDPPEPPPGPDPTPIPTVIPASETARWALLFERLDHITRLLEGLTGG